MSDAVRKAGRIVVDDPGYHPDAAWWKDFPRSEGPIVIIMSRLHEADLAGDVEIEPGEFQYIDLPMEWPMSGFYEVLPTIKSEDGADTLAASFTPNNGIRVMIANEDLGPDWASFDFTDDQAEAIGQALVRWAQRNRAEAEGIRCGWVRRERQE